MPKQTPKKEPHKHKTESSYLTISSGIIVILILSIFNLFLYSSSYSNNVLGARTGVDFNNLLIQEKNFWEKIVSENPTYLDGWLELAKINYKLGDMGYAQGALNTARAIDPNSDKIENLEKELGLLGF